MENDTTNSLIINVLNKTLENSTINIISEPYSTLSETLAGITSYFNAFLLWYSIFFVCVAEFSLIGGYCSLISEEFAIGFIVCVLIIGVPFVIIYLICYFIITMIISQKMRCLVYLILLFIVFVVCSWYSIKRYNLN